MEILLIEVNPEVVSLIKECLSNFQPPIPTQLIWKTDLDSGFSEIQINQKIDLMLLDLALIEPNESETYTRVIQNDLKIPCIVLCDHKNKEVVLKSVKFGADDCIFKSEITPDVLHKSIIYALERKKRQINSIKNTNRMNLILNSVQIGIIIIEKKTCKIIEINEKISNMMQKPMDKIIGLKCHDIIFPCPIQQCQTKIQETIQLNVQSNLMISKNMKLPILINQNSINFDQNDSFLLSILDISEHKKSYDLMQLHANLEALAMDISLISHQTTKIDHFLEKICNIIITALNINTISIYSIDEIHFTIKEVHNRKLNQNSNDPFLDEIVSTKLSQEIAMFQCLQCKIFTTKLHKYPILMFPLFIDEKLAFLLFLEMRDDNSESLSPIIDFLQTISNMISHIITNIFNKNKLEDLVEARTEELKKTIRDLENQIKERKILETQLIQAKEIAVFANQSKTHFLANLSHELRTPLNSILGFSELIMDRNLGAINTEQEDAIKNVNESGKCLLNLINDLLDISRIETGQVTIQKQSINMNTLIKESIVLFQNQIQDFALKLDLELDPRLPNVNIDKTKMLQVFTNLLSNACKYTKLGGQIGIKTTYDPHNIFINFCDNGVGIPEEFQSSLFEPFSQLAPVSSHEKTGTGLGLFMSKKIVELHGGVITFCSMVDKGTEIQIILPRQ